MKTKIVFALVTFLMFGNVKLNAQENGNSQNSESTTSLEGDLNHDGKVNAADITYLVNIIMNIDNSQNDPETVSVTGVTISAPSTSINIGETVQLTANISPSNASNKAVSWSSNNTSVANVNTSGLVTGISNGTATITVTTVDGNKTANKTITIPRTQPTTYYWYIGVDNPSSISNVQTDNTIGGWHEIGASLSGFMLDTNGTSNRVQLSETRVIYNVIIPNDLHIYAADGTTNVENTYFNSITSNISGYKAFRSIPSEEFPEGDRFVTGIIIK